MLQPSMQGSYTFDGGAGGQQRSTTFTVAGSTKHQCVKIDGSQYCTQP